MIKYILGYTISYFYSDLAVETIVKDNLFDSLDEALKESFFIKNKFINTARDQLAKKINAANGVEFENVFEIEEDFNKNSFTVTFSNNDYYWLLYSIKTFIKEITI